MSVVFFAKNKFCFCGTAFAAALSSHFKVCDAEAEAVKLRVEFWGEQCPAAHSVCDSHYHSTAMAHAVVVMAGGGGSLCLCLLLRGALASTCC